MSYGGCSRKVTNYDRRVYIIKNRHISNRVKIMKAVCKKCKYEISGADRPQLEQRFRAHSETYGHMQFDIVNYD
jgi:hypothetical protein